MTLLRKTLSVVQPLFLLLAFAFLGILIFRQWTALRAYEWHVHPVWLATSGVCLVAGGLLEVRLWQHLLATMGGRLHFGTALRIWFTSGIVRFVPGSIWQPLSMAMQSRDQGVTPEAALAGFSLFHLIRLVMVCPIVVVYLLVWGRGGAIARFLGSFSPWWAALVAIPVVIFLLRPHQALALPNVILVRLGRAPLPRDFSTGQLLRLSGVALAGWGGFCAGFWALSTALVQPPGASPWETLPHLAVAYVLAYAVGLLTIVAPSGLAVREGILILLLEPVLDRPGALIAALAMRVWETAIEFAVTGVVIGIHWIRRTRGPLR